MTNVTDSRPGNGAINNDSGKPTFEVSLELLQQTVKRLESGELSLDQALKYFEEGVKLTRLCQEQLAAAEQRVEILLKAPSAAETSPEFKPFTLGTQGAPRG